jgi:SHS family lactate transporter-like MFS transporter
VAGTVAIVIAILTALGAEARGVTFGQARIRMAQTAPTAAASPLPSSG